MDIPGYITITGVDVPIRGRMTWQNGLVPSVSSIEFLPQETLIPPVVDLEAQLNGVSVVIPGCRVRSVGTRQTSSGAIVTAVVEDFRWRWQFAYFSAAWNVRKRDGQIDESTRVDLQQIIRTLAERLGVVATLVNVPSDNPEMVFTGEQVTRVLSALLNDYSLVACPTFNGGVTFRPVGVGAALPDELTQTTLPAENVSRPAAPETIQVWAEPNRYQMQLSLEAVGLEEDGRIVPVDDLSYAPDAGWETYARVMDTIGINDGEDLTADQKKLVKRCIGKWFRVRMDDADNQIAAYYPDTELDENSSVDCVTPLYPDLVHRSLPVGVELSARDRPRVFGLRVLPISGENSSLSNRWEVPQSDWVLDETRGIVAFNEEQWRLVAGAAGNQTWDFATLYLEASFSVELNRYSDPKREFVDIPTGIPYGEGTEVIQVRGTAYERYLDYGPAGEGPTTINSYISQQAVRDRLTQIGNRRLAYYTSGGAPQASVNGQARYADLIYVELDGAINALEYLFDADAGQPFTTTLYRLQENIPWQKRPEDVRVEAFVKQQQAKEKAEAFAWLGKNLLPVAGIPFR